MSSRLSIDTSQDDEPFHRATSTDRHRFRPRSPEEVLVKVKAWEGYLHQRARQYWDNPEGIREVLMKIAQCIDKECDPILGDPRECVFWHGDYDDRFDRPVMRIVKPDEPTETVTFVTRTIVYLYADQESYEELNMRKEGPFDLICNEPHCVNINHIAL